MFQINAWSSRKNHFLLVDHDNNTNNNINVLTLKQIQKLYLFIYYYYYLPHLLLLFTTQEIKILPFQFLFFAFIGVKGISSFLTKLLNY